MVGNKIVVAQISRLQMLTTTTWQQQICCSKSPFQVVGSQQRFHQISVANQARAGCIQATKAPALPLQLPEIAYILK